MSPAHSPAALAQILTKDADDARTLVPVIIRARFLLGASDSSTLARNHQSGRAHALATLGMQLHYVCTEICNIVGPALPY